MIKTALVLASLLLVGCGSAVSPEEVAEAEKLCAPYGGVERIYPVWGHLQFDVRCANGSTLDVFIVEHRGQHDQK